MLCLFRVVQESLQNAIKHSGAGGASVDLSDGPDGLTLRIVDRGVGFEVAAASGLGVGVVSMQERVEGIGGTLDIVSSHGTGTCVTATIPAHVIENEHASLDAAEA
jgi:signal transduction histidine kinase